MCYRHATAPTTGAELDARAVGPGALWVATGSTDILQRFDIP